jgi:hypothetical protein
MASQDIQIRIKTALDAAETTKGLKDTKKLLKELNSLALETQDTNSEAFKNITASIADTNDRLRDTKELIAAQTGEPIEKVSQSFNGLKNSIYNLDFKMLKSQFGILTDGVQGLGSQFLSGFNVIGNYNKSIGEGIPKLNALSGAFKSLGASIAATGIGALIIAAGLLFVYFDKLKGAGGALGKVFDVVSGIVESFTNSLYNLMVVIGLVGAKEDESTKNYISNKNKEIDALEKRKTATIDAIDAEI